jgi:hypothetical protein
VPEQTTTVSRPSESFNRNLMSRQEQALGDVVRRCRVRYHSGLHERNDAWRIGSVCVRRSSRKRNSKTSERGHTAYSVVPSYRLRDMLARRSHAFSSQDDRDGGREYVQKSFWVCTQHASPPWTHLGPRSACVSPCNDQCGSGQCAGRVGPLGARRGLPGQAFSRESTSTIACVECPDERRRGVGRLRQTVCLSKQEDQKGTAR